MIPVDSHKNDLYFVFIMFKISNGTNNYITCYKILLFAIISSILGGCEPEENILGNWRGEQYFKNNDKSTSTTHIKSDVVLNIFASGKYSLIEGGIPSSGRWYRQNKKYILEPEYIYGKHRSHFDDVKDKYYKVPIKIRVIKRNIILFYRPDMKSHRISLRKNYVPAMRTKDTLQKLYNG